MVGYPSLEQYQTALQHPEHVFTDPELKRGQIKVTGLGLPLVQCGGFALTYSVNVGAHRYAVRCFHKESKHLEDRYEGSLAPGQYHRTPTPDTRNWL